MKRARNEITTPTDEISHRQCSCVWRKVVSIPTISDHIIDDGSFPASNYV